MPTTASLAEEIHEATPPAPHRPSVLGAVYDAVLDTAVLSFAVWTLLYSLGLATQWSLWPSGWLWAVLTLGILVWELRRALTTHPGAPSAEVAAAEASAGWWGPLARLERARPLLLAGGLVFIAVTTVGGLVWTPGTFKITWAALVLAMVLLTLWALLSGRFGAAGSAAQVDGQVDGRVEETSGRRWATLPDLGVLAVMVFVGVMTSLVHLQDTDDPYYVNRSVWVAERGNASLLDTMFSPEDFDTAYGGGIPIASIESLFGVVAHMTGTLAGTITYIVAAPVGAVLAVLAMWRLTRRWAPRRAFAAFVIAVMFLMLSGDSFLGNFWIVRMWQGKVIAVAMLMPLMWAYLTELAETTDRRERWRTIGLLLAAGIAFYGLTPTAVVWGPFMLAIALAAAVVVRSKWLAVGGVALFVGPFLSGVAVIVFSTDVGGANPVPMPARWSFARILGETGPMVALALVALGVAVLMARRGAASALAGASALVSVLVFAPGILPLVNAVTGSGPILWRMLYLAPIAVLVGLLVAMPVPDLRRARASLARVVPLVPVAAVVLGLGLGGIPVWSETGHRGVVTLRSGPSWKVDTEALNDVRRMMDDGVTGEVLMPPRHMKVLTMYSVDAFPVVPRDWFIKNIDEPTRTQWARRLLLRLTDAEAELSSVTKTEKALRRVEVDLACVGSTPFREQQLELLADAGYASGLSRYGTLTCVRPDA